MKNQGVWLLLIVMIIFASILIGFFLGRNTGRAEIQISKLPQPTAASGTTQQTDKININTADVETLQKLPGIGPALAQRIVDFRETNGPFQTVTQLTSVSGIGVEKLNQILDYITV